MSTLLTIEEQALALPEQDRAHLAEVLLLSLPHDQEYEDECIAEALRRDAEMTADPSCVVPFEEMKRRILSR